MTLSNPSWRTPISSSENFLKACDSAFFIWASTVFLRPFPDSVRKINLFRLSLSRMALLMNPFFLKWWMWRDMVVLSLLVFSAISLWFSPSFFQRQFSTWHCSAVKSIRCSSSNLLSRQVNALSAMLTILIGEGCCSCNCFFKSIHL